MRIFVFLCIISVMLLAAPSPAAQSAADYQPAGAPADVRVEARWNRYHDYAEATALLQQLAAAHPDCATLESLGQSYGGREMWVLTVADPAGGPLDARPGFWIDGGIHANEIQSSEVVLYTAWYLLEARAYSPFIARLLRERTFYLMPMMSPDGRDAHFHEPATTDDPRTGLRPVDNDRDGLIDEDGPDDLDGDGSHTFMRVADPNGRWKADPDFPLRMRQCAPDERGEYTLFFEEGFDNDGDGRINEDGPGGYDPNRDWAWGWQPRYVQWGAWKYPFSVGENRLVADFIMARPHIAGAQSYHNSGGMVLHGPGQGTDPYPAADAELYDFIGARGAELLPGYRNMVLWRDLYPVWGGEIDWLYKMHGALTYTNELFTSFNYFRDPAAGGDWNAGDAAEWKFDKYLLFGEGMTPWTKVAHPQFGTVEVGGGKSKHWGRQPPSFLLEEECHRNFAFTMFHADALPRLEVQRVDVEPLEPGLSQVTAVIANRGMMPTRLAVDVQHGISAPDRITLSGADGAAARALAGYTASTPFFLDSVEQREHPEALRVAAIPGNGAVYARWIAAGSGPFTVSVRSVKGGAAQATSAP